MIRARLEELSLEALFDLAGRNGLILGPDSDRSTVIDELTEIIMENREERERGNSVTVRIQQKKYALVTDDETPLSSINVDEFNLPERYETNRIVLMLRDPRWAFTYWNISSTKKRLFEETAKFDGLFLRVLQVASASREIVIQDSFEIPVRLEDTSWYIHIPRQQTFYRIQLVAKINRRRELLAISNSVRVPPMYLPVAPEDMTPEQMALYELCGIEYLEVDPFGRNTFPAVRE